MLLAKHSSREVPLSPKYAHHDGSQNNMQENSGWILSIYIFFAHQVTQFWEHVILFQTYFGRRVHFLYF